ncbi:MAG: DUF2938 domain-containing protein [Proteobacteria bacterium]|nr:DUF2938 domain-containing protein [Pseudomonadota bacterium]
MINIIEMILMGVFATFVMDLFAVFLGKLKIINQQLEPEVVGRWSLYMLKGKFIHADIYKTPALKNEKLGAFCSHYLIGIALAGIYLFIELIEPTIRAQIWMPLIFGLATVLLPWLWLYPSIGIGFFASKAPKRSPYIIASFVNHADFGLGLMIWVVCFRRFFI